MSKIILFVIVLSLTACDKPAPVASGSSKGSDAKTSSSALPESLFLTAAPPDARDIKAAKADLKPGDKVVLVGRIGGSEEPFVAERAMFTLVDRQLKACGEGNPDDGCKTPWDFCCEDIDDIAANSAPVRIVGTDGQPLKAELNGLRGLKPLATVTLTGTVASVEAGNLLVNANGLFVGP